MLSRVEQLEHLCLDMRTISRSESRRQVEAELQSILASQSFRTSQRSRKFLRYVMERALAGEFDALKERVLGVEVYRRDSLFNTEQDSIVRVAASDVRRRLSEYYRERPDSPVRITIPTGVYVPRIEFVANHAAVPEAIPEAPAVPWKRSLRPVALGLVVIMLGVGALFFRAIARGDAARKSAQTVPPPVWSGLLKLQRPITVAVADANLVITKVRSSRDVPIGTYASHEFQYAPDLKGHLGDYLNHIPLTTVSDAMLAARIATLCARHGGEAVVKHSNRLDSADFKSSNPIIILGSATSNPWAGLLETKLNFLMVHEFDTGVEICVNRTPRPGESGKYVPRSDPQGISEGYALIALTQNLSGSAPVLLIAGTSTEGTEAAGEFVTNPEKLNSALMKLGIGARSDIQQLELLIKTSFVSASAVNAEIIAWRVR